MQKPSSPETPIKEQGGDSQSKPSPVVNPSLRETPIHEPADVIPSKQQTSLLDWLKNTGRLIKRDTLEPIEGYAQEQEDISELIVEDASYENDDSEEEVES